MSGFFRHDNGAVPLGDIGSITWTKPMMHAGHYVVACHGASSLRLSPWEYRDLMARPVQLIQAEAGTKLLTLYVSGKPEEDFADPLPILCWALCADGAVRAILPSGVRRGFDPDMHQGHWIPDYILMPDGSIYAEGYEADHDRFDSVDAVLAFERRRFLKHQEEEDRKLERAAPEPPLPKEDDPAEVFDRHARWVAAQPAEEVSA